MKNIVKNLALVGVGAAGGFVACSYLIVKKALKSDTFREVIATKISDKIEEWLFDEKEVTDTTDNDGNSIAIAKRNLCELESQDKGDENS